MATTTYNFTVHPEDGWVQVANASGFLRVSAFPCDASFYLYVGDTAPTSTTAAIGIYVPHGKYWSNVAFSGNAYVRAPSRDIRVDVEAIPSGGSGTASSGAGGPATGTSRIASSAAGGSPTVAKVGPGSLRQFWGQNAAAVTYLQIYNLATTPVLGTSTPVLTYPIPASAAFSMSIPDGLYLPVGTAYAFTTDAAGTTGAAAAAITAFALLTS